MKKRKTSTIAIRVTAEEKQLIEINAINKRMSTSQFLRSKALEDE